jgi:hypothetical protein
LQYQTTPF